MHPKFENIFRRLSADQRSKTKTENDSLLMRFPIKNYPGKTVSHYICSRFFTSPHKSINPYVKVEPRDQGSMNVNAIATGSVIRGCQHENKSSNEWLIDEQYAIRNKNTGNDSSIEGKVKREQVQSQTQETQQRELQRALQLQFQQFHLQQEAPEFTRPRQFPQAKQPLQQLPTQPSASRPYQCRVDPNCGKCFRDASTRTRHEKIHSPQKYACNICGIEYSRKDNRNRHEAKCISSKKRQRRKQSEAQTKLFGRISSLSIHESKENPQKNFLTVSSRFKSKFKSKRKRAWMVNGVLQHTEPKAESKASLGFH